MPWNIDWPQLHVMCPLYAYRGGPVLFADHSKKNISCTKYDGPNWQSILNKETVKFYTIYSFPAVRIELFG